MSYSPVKRGNLASRAASIKKLKKQYVQKEKDLELAAKIGQSLLEQNRELQQRNEFLEEQCTAANEQMTQLKYELNQKTDLLHIYAESESDATSPQEEDRDSESLMKKMQYLEQENTNLKSEVCLHTSSTVFLFYRPAQATLRSPGMLEAGLSVGSHTRLKNP